MKRVALYCVFMLWPALQWGLADPVSVTINPPFQAAFTGSVAVVQVMISGLGQGTSPSLGAFDLVITYDPKILGIANITFGGVFGDQLNLSGFGSATFIDQSVPGTIHLEEVSFDPVNTIDRLQQSSFILVTINFHVVGAGTSPLGLSNITLGDSPGNPLPVLPANIQGGSLSASTATGTPGGTCVVTVTSTPTVRIEGTLELLGSILLSCGPGVTAAPVTLSVILQPATATIAPGSSSPDNASTFPLPIMTTNLPRPSSPVSGLTVTTAGNIASFNFVPVPAAQTFTISGIRANLAGSGLADGTSVSAILVAAPSLPGQLTFANSSVVVAFARRGLDPASGFSGPVLNIPSCAPPVATPAGTPSVIPVNPDTSGGSVNSLKVTLIQGFPGAWQTAAGEEGGLGGLQGTRFLITLTSIPTGYAVYAPAMAGLGSPLLTLVTGSNADGSAGSLSPFTTGSFQNIAITDGTATIVYEVTAINASSTLSSVPLSIALTGTAPAGVGTIRGTVSFAPVGPPTLSPARPQFGAGSVGRDVANSTPCATYLLFPWVASSGDGGLDTGIAVSNTTADPPAIGTAAQRGDVTLYFFSSDGKAQPSPVTISPPGGLQAGQTATFVLSQLGIPFQGYVMAVCRFLMAHGLAFIDRPQNGRGLATYLALVVTNPRTTSQGVTAPAESTFH